MPCSQQILLCWDTMPLFSMRRLVTLSSAHCFVSVLLVLCGAIVRRRSSGVFCFAASHILSPLTWLIVVDRDLKSKPHPFVSSPFPLRRMFSLLRRYTVYGVRVHKTCVCPVSPLWWRLVPVQVPGTLLLPCRQVDSKKCSLSMGALNDGHAKDRIILLLTKIAFRFTWNWTAMVS